MLWPFIAFWRTYTISNFLNWRYHLANRSLRTSFDITNLMGLDLQIRRTIWSWSSVSYSKLRRLRRNIAFRLASNSSHLVSSSYSSIQGNFLSLCHYLGLRVLLLIFLELICKVSMDFQEYVRLKLVVLSNKTWCSQSHYYNFAPIRKEFIFFIRWLNGWYFPTRFKMNLLRYASFVADSSIYGFFLARSSLDASIFAWSIFISQCRTMKPRNFSKVTPNMHFKGFFLSWYLHSSSNTILKSWQWSHFSLISVLNHQRNIQIFCEECYKIFGMFLLRSLNQKELLRSNKCP